MKVKVVTLENKAAGEVELSDAIFGLEVRKDLLHRMVEKPFQAKRHGFRTSGFAP
jgi:large subunit ribosomal protein L4